MIHFTPERLTYDAIKDKAEEFRGGHPKAQKFPVDIEEVIEFDLGLDIVPARQLCLKTGVEAFLSNDLKSIWVDYEKYHHEYTQARLRFTLAEEVGHYHLHKSIYVQGVNYESEGDFIRDVRGMDEDCVTWIDRQAREFAGRLLVPLEKLEEEIAKNKGRIEDYLKTSTNNDCSDLAKEAFSRRVCANFKVSWEVVKNRIRSEKLSYHFELD